MKNRTLETIYLAVGLLFVVFIIFLFSHLCFGYDEYIWKTCHLRYGFLGYFKYVYNCCSFRYSTHFYLYFIFAFCNSDYYRVTVFISQALVVFITMVSMYSVFKTIFTAVLIIKPTRKQLIISSTVFSA